MSFASVLNEYCETVGCTNRQLAEACGLSPSAVSRYRNGGRVPQAESGTPVQLARGLARLAGEAGSPDAAPAATVAERLQRELDAPRAQVASFGANLDALMSLLGLRNVDLAQAANVDASYVSRVRLGSRRPAQAAHLAQAAAEMAARRAVEHGRTQELCALLGEAAPDGLPSTHGELSAAVASWLQAGAPQQPDAPVAATFFEALDTFDLNDYLASMRYDEIKLPTRPVLPTSRWCTGLEEMRKAELQFQRTTATSARTRTVRMYSDMDMTEMARDEEFSRKWAAGLGAMVKRGAHLHVIHDVSRPPREMLLGLIAWIPPYMTGQVSPYYLPGVNERPFRQLCFVSDAAALSGEALSTDPLSGRYYFSTRAEDVTYAQRRLEQLLQSARPLMEIFREDQPARLAAFQAAEQARAATGLGTPVGEGVFANLSIVVYPDCAVVSKANPPAIHFVIRHPLLRDAIARL